MARSGASSHYINIASSLVDPVLGGTNNAFLNAYSMHCLVKSSVAPNTGSIRSAMAIVGDNTSSANNPLDVLGWDHTSSTFTKSGIHRQSNGSFINAQYISSLSANTWYGYGSSYDGTTVRLYLNGALVASSLSTSVSQNKKVFMSVLAELLSDGSTEGQFSNGDVAEPGFWNAALTNDEFNALGKGFRPFRIRPQNLISYLSLVRPTQDLKGYTWTDVNSPTVTDHPPVFG